MFDFRMYFLKATIYNLSDRLAKKEINMKRFLSKLRDKEPFLIRFYTHPPNQEFQRKATQRLGDGSKTFY